MKTFSLRQDSTSRKWLQYFLFAVPVAALIFFVTPKSPPGYLSATAVFVVVAAVFVLADRRKHVRIELTETTLQVKGDLFGKIWPYFTLAIEDARVIDLAVDHGYLPKWKLCGTSMSGYQSGEFKLRNQKLATIFLSSRATVALIPFRSGSILLLSVGEDFLEALQKAANLERQRIDRG